MRGELSIPISSLLGFLLVLTRVAGAFTFVPIPGVQNSPGAAKVVVVLGISVALAPVWPQVAWSGGAGELMMFVLREACLGLGIGLVISMTTEAVLACFQTLGLQAGYTFASTVDPVTRADTGVLIVFGQLAAGLLFFAVGLHHQVLQALAASFQLQKAGEVHLPVGLWEPVVRLGSGIFVIGLRLALPVVVSLIMVDVSLALMGRINAQLQMLTLAFPVKMLGALALTALLLAALPKVYAEYANSAMKVVRILLGSG